MGLAIIYALPLIAMGVWIIVAKLMYRAMRWADIPEFVSRLLAVTLFPGAVLLSNPDFWHSILNPLSQLWPLRAIIGLSAVVTMLLWLGQRPTHQNVRDNTLSARWIFVFTLHILAWMNPVFALAMLPNSLQQTISAFL